MNEFRAILEEDRKWLLAVARRLLGLHQILASQPWLQSTYDAFKAAYDAAEQRRKEILEGIERIKPDSRFPAQIGALIVDLQHAGAAFHRAKDVFRDTFTTKIGESLAPIAAMVQTGSISDQQIYAIVQIYREIESLGVDEKPEKTPWFSYLLAFLAGGATDHLVFKRPVGQVVALGGVK